VHPLGELKRLLASRRGRRTGTVITVEDGQARVATAAGVVLAAVGQATVHAGERVAIEDGRVIGRLSAAAPPVYEV